MKRTLLTCLSVNGYDNDFFRIHGLWQNPDGLKFYCPGEKQIWSANIGKAPVFETYSE
jgi:hypothetical protein